MTDLPTSTQKKLGLVVDLNACVGCHACAVSCKEWNTGGYSAPLTDTNPYDAKPDGVWFNRVHTYELENDSGGRTVNFPRACLHCETPACVTVCPTGASFKREEDGIVLVNPDTCIGCKLCSWACPYGAREYDEDDGIMKKCTLCVDRIYNQNIPVEERQPACVSACPTNARHFGDFADPDSNVSKLTRERDGYSLMPEAGCQPTWQYLPPVVRKSGAEEAKPATPKIRNAMDKQPEVTANSGFLGWVDRMLTR